MFEGQCSAQLAALASLLQESVRHWGFARQVEVVTLAAAHDEPTQRIVLLDTTSNFATQVLTVEHLGEQAPEQAPMRWLVLTAQAQPETLRTHHYCSSVLHVLRTIREVSDPAFRPGKRLRMGVASLRL
ncbi:MAG: hypothetical protein CK528_04645 [Alcaligenaceae bacterium]|nr:MAG: hypothetical protein CK528_04645 [Alcaligenaceae bacterium]